MRPVSEVGEVGEEAGKMLVTLTILDDTFLLYYHMLLQYQSLIHNTVMHLT